MNSEKIISVNFTSNRYQFVKRFLDISLSLLALICFFPLYLLVFICIGLSSSGFPLLAQERLGKGGKVFKCYKFRTMYIDAEKLLNSLLLHDETLAKEWEQNQKLQDDPRICPLGKFLRKSSLDELPQFWNVLKGDLSLVGPRPYLVNQKKDLGVLSYTILSVKPGLTGLWQVSGRSKTTFLERIHLDARYVSQKSTLFDLQLILKTFPTLLFPKDAC